MKPSKATECPVAALTLVLGLMLLGAGPAEAATYKWVDDQGVVHYSDKIPPEAVVKGATVLDKQGRPAKKIEPAPTPEQAKAKSAAEEQQRALAKALDDQARKDKALMQSYTTEDEIDVARTRALATIDTQVKSAQTYSADLTRRQETLKRQKASYGGKAIPIELERELNTVDVELARQTTLIKQKSEEIAAVNAKYDSDKKRWEEIKSDQQRSAAAAAAVAAQEAAKGSATAPPAKK